MDIDPAEINKNVRVDVALVGDLRNILRELLPRVEVSDRREWLQYIHSLKGDSAVRDIQNLPDSGHLFAAHVINDLWRETRDEDTIVVTDVGQHQMWEAQYYKHELPRSLITSGGLGTMGFALPAGIGAKVARPEADANQPSFGPLQSRDRIPTHLKQGTDTLADRIAACQQFLKVAHLVQSLFVVTHPVSISKPDTRFFSCTICRTSRCRYRSVRRRSRISVDAM